MKNIFKINEKQYFTILEASKIMNEKYMTVYKKLNKFEIMKIGSLILIEAESINEYLKWKNKYKK